MKILINTDILVEDRGRAIPTVAGLLLFGANPNRYLPQAGVTATSFKGLEKDYDTFDEENIRGPSVSFGLRQPQPVLAAHRALRDNRMAD